MASALFLFHATTLVVFTGFPAVPQRGDLLYCADCFADKTFDPIIPFPIVVPCFNGFTLGLTMLSGMTDHRLNRHLPANTRTRMRYRPQIIR